MQRVHRTPCFSLLNKTKTHLSGYTHLDKINICML